MMKSIQDKFWHWIPFILGVLIGILILCAPNLALESTRAIPHRLLH